MGLREQLMNDLKEAMRQRDERRRETIRSVLAAIKKAETELDSSGARIVLDERGLVAIVNKQAKIRQESIDAFRAGGREDLVTKEEAELAILQNYLPRQLTREEIEAQARRIIGEAGASGPRDIGKVMKPLMAELRGQADGRLVNQIVRELLAG
jgi:uncharacterized protein YqeY